MSVCVATAGMYWQPAIPGGGPGGYTFGNDKPGFPKRKRLKVVVKKVNTFRENIQIKVQIDD